MLRAPRRIISQALTRLGGVSQVWMGGMVLYEPSPKYYQGELKVWPRQKKRDLGRPTSMQRKQTIMIPGNKARILYLDCPLKWSKMPIFDLVVAPSSSTPKKYTNKPFNMLEQHLEK
jgi:hypothetical protein